jgi:hypothetical protein
VQASQTSATSSTGCYGSEPDGDGGLCVVPHEALIIRRLFRTCAGPAAGAPTPPESWPASVAARQTHPSANPLHVERRGAPRSGGGGMCGPHARLGRAASRPRRGPLAPRSDAGGARPRASPRLTSRKATSLRFAKNPGNPSPFALNIANSYFVLPRCIAFRYFALPGPGLFAFSRTRARLRGGLLVKPLRDLLGLAERAVIRAPRRPADVSRAGRHPSAAYSGVSCTTATLRYRPGRTPVITMSLVTRISSLQSL